MFGGWTEHTRNLPAQIAVEVHYIPNPAVGTSEPPETHPMFGRPAMSTADLALFFAHMANLGYGIVASEPNPLCGECSEYTLLRIEAAA